MKIKADTASTLLERYPHLPLKADQILIDRYHAAGHSTEWITWWMKFSREFPKRRMSTNTEAKHFIISMDGPGASKFAKKYSQLKLFT